MFNGQRFITNGVSNEIPIYLQVILWYMIELLPEPMDYVQVFELSEEIVDGKVNQKIIHTQENPTYKREYLLSAKSGVAQKVYIIDDGAHSTMLLANEY